jgi:hypothetical protein
MSDCLLDKQQRRSGDSAQAQCGEIPPEENGIPKLVVSTWNRKPWGNDTLHRVAMLSEAIKLTEKKIEDAKLDSLGTIKAVFVAPEYNFTTQYASGQTGKDFASRSLGSFERLEILKQLTHISQAHRRILIIPGTVAWQRPFQQKEMLVAMSYYSKWATYTTLSESDQIKEVCEWWYRLSGSNALINITSYEKERQNGTSRMVTRLSESEISKIKSADPDFYEDIVGYSL